MTFNDNDVSDDNDDDDGDDRCKCTFVAFWTKVLAAKKCPCSRMMRLHQIGPIRIDRFALKAIFFLRGNTVNSIVEIPILFTATV